MLERWSAAPFRPTNAFEDRALWAAYHRYRRARMAESAPDEPVESDAVVEHRFQQVRDEMLHHRYAVIEDGEIISFADIAVARPDSGNFESRRHTLQLDIGVLEPFRRRDIATNWLSLVIEAMNLHGASRVVAAVTEADGHGFARWLGAEVAHVDQVARCEVGTIDRDRLLEWVERAEARGLRFTVIDHRLTSVQRERYAGLADSLASAVARDPADPPSSRDPLNALDALQDLLDVAGGRHYLVMAHDQEGRGLGIADAIWSPDAPTRADLLSVALRSIGDSRKDDAEGIDESFMLALARGLKATLVLKLLRSVHGLQALRAAHRGADEALLSLDGEIGFQTHRIITTYRIEHDQLVERLKSVGLI